jgi:hypothetical protein
MHVFISHPHSEKQTAKRLAEALQLHGISTWLDTGDLSHGDDLQIQIEHVLRAASVILFLIAPGQEANRWQEREWSIALEASWEDPNKRLIPLLLGDAEPPAFLRDRASLRLTNNPADWDRTVGKLVEMIRSGAISEDDRRKIAKEKTEWRVRLQNLESEANALRPVTISEHSKLP